MITASAREAGNFPAAVEEHRERLLTAPVATGGFSVAQNHDVFGGAGVIAFGAAMLKSAHETVLGFARDMKLRVGEYFGRLLSQGIGTRRRQNVRVRPWRLEGFKVWRDRMKGGRDEIEDQPPRIARGEMAHRHPA